MDGLVVLSLVVGMLILFGVLAFEVGVDSRVGSADARRPEGNLSI